MRPRTAREPLPARQDLLGEHDGRDHEHPEEAHHPHGEEHENQAPAAADAVAPWTTPACGAAPPGRQCRSTKNSGPRTVPEADGLQRRQPGTRPGGNDGAAGRRTARRRPRRGDRRRPSSSRSRLYAAAPSAVHVARYPRRRRRSTRPPACAAPAPPRRAKTLTVDAAAGSIIAAVIVTHTPRNQTNAPGSVPGPASSRPCGRPRRARPRARSPATRRQPRAAGAPRCNVLSFALIERESIARHPPAEEYVAR